MSESQGVTYNLTTEVVNDEIIQTLSSSTSAVLQKWVLETREKSVKERLIQMGWTPPNQRQEITDEQIIEVLNLESEMENTDFWGFTEEKAIKKAREILEGPKQGEG